MTLQAHAFLMLGFVALHTFAQEYPDVDTGFRLRLVRQGGPTPHLAALVETTELYPCEGYAVLAQVTRRLDTITIAFGGMRRPSPCLNTFSPATATVTLGNLGGGTYTLRLTYRGEADLFRLSIRNGVPRTVPLSRHFTSITQ